MVGKGGRGSALCVTVGVGGGVIRGGKGGGKGEGELGWRVGV